MTAVRVFLMVFLLGMSLVIAQGVGSQAPDFVLIDTTGNPIRLSDLQGTPILLNFWATWCPPCQEELPLFQRISDELGNDLQILLVNNNEGRERATAYLQAHDLTLQAAFDATRAEQEQLAREGVEVDTTLDVLRRYRARGMPTTIFIDEDGIIRGMWVGLITPAKTTELLAEIGVTWQP
jgi:cytochrome c biogenesis protein CcmG/thiol:disulfide interchange protein DsbE